MRIPFLNEKVVNFFYDSYEKKGYVKRWKGRLLWAIDCSKINIPDTEETRAKYSVQTCDVLNEICINSSIDGIKNEKSFLFNEHKNHFRKDAIFIYDRLYADYSVIASHIKKGIDFVIRCPLTNSFKYIGIFINSDCIDEVVSLKVTDRQKKFVQENGLPEEITVRFVKVKLDNGEIEVLITSLLDRGEYKVKDFKWLYNMRWGIETFLDRLKNQLEVEKILADLKRKAALVKWHNAEREEHYGIIAKTIEEKEALRKKGYLAFDLNDFKSNF